ALGVGFAFLGASAVTLPNRAADRVFFAWWLGIAAVAWTSFALVNVLPLRTASPGLGAVTLIVAVWGLARSRLVWRDLHPIPWIAFIALALVLAERSVAVGPLADTGGQHWTVVVCWKMLANAEEESRSEATTSTLALLAAVAVTIKLNALPLALVCAALLWTARGIALRMRWMTTAVLVVIVAPLLLASWTST